MTDKQERQLNSFLTLEKDINDMKAELTKFPEVTECALLIKNRKGKIEGLHKIQMNAAKGETGFKQGIRTILNGHYDTLVGAIKASIDEDTTLTAKYVKKNPSDLITERDGKVAGVVQSAVDDARPLLTKLDRYDVTVALLAEIETLAPSYNDALAGQSSAGNKSKNATAEMAAIFEEILNKLNKTDIKVEPLEKTKPAIFNMWFEGRKEKGN